MRLLLHWEMSKFELNIIFTIRFAFVKPYFWAILYEKQFIFLIQVYCPVKY